MAKNFITLKSYYPLKIHIIQEHQNANQFKCVLCKARFFTQEILDKHMNELHEGCQPTVCDICGNTFG